LHALQPTPEADGGRERVAAQVEVVDDASPGIDVAELLRGWGIDGVTVHRRAACRTQPGAGCAGGVSDEENGSIPRSLRGFGPRCLAENLRA
jgi:hypothetical protein